MILKRKDSAPLEEATGVVHSEAVIAVVWHTLNHQMKDLHINMNVFTSLDAFNNGKAPLTYPILPFHFTSANTPPDMANAAAVVAALMANAPNLYDIIPTINFGYGDTDYVVSDMLDLENGCNPQNDIAKLWIMEQKDHEGLPFYVNWELMDESNAKFDYEDTLLTVLTA